MIKGTLQIIGGSLCLLVFLVGVAPIADALYACGLWPRLTPEELQIRLQRTYSTRVTECAYGTNGWEYICKLGPTPPGVRQFYDKIGVQGSPYGAGAISEMRPGPVPAWKGVR